MKRVLIAGVLALALSGCGVGGSTAAPPTLSPTPKPTATPTGSPISVATSTPAPSPSPTSAPKSVRRIGGAPITATAAQLSSLGRRTESVQGIADGLPILVESSGMVATWAGDQAIWVTDAQTQANIPETSGTVTPSGNLPVNNPSFSPIPCASAGTAVCIVHPDAWTFGTTSANGKPIGQQTITISFSDGTSGTTFDDVYDGWIIRSCGTGVAYQGGVPVATTTQATSDVYTDCANGNLVFPKGAVLASNPTADQFGNYATVLPTIKAAIIMGPSLIVNVPFASITPGQVFGVNTQDGGVAKFYMVSPADNTGFVEGMSLHANLDGTYPF